MIGALIVKDLKLFFRNRFFAVITALSLVMFIALYFLIPSEINDSIGLAFYIENPAITSLDEVAERNESIDVFTDEAAMIAAVDAEEYFVGLSFPEEDVLALANGDEVTFDAYYMPGMPAEAKQIYDDVMVFLANGGNPEFAANLERVDIPLVTLGNDLVGAPLSYRDRILPMLLLFILSVELLGLATLINREVERGTMRALITGPLRLHHFFTGKVLLGLILAFSQLLIVMVITGRIATSPLLLATTLLLGSFSFVGVSFFIAAVAKDNMSVMAWGVFVMLLFIIPAISVMLPGLASGWMELIPSFFLVDSLHRILNFDAGWSDVGRSLAIMFVTGLGLTASGAALVRRRF